MKIWSINSCIFNSQCEKLIFDHAKTFDMTFIQKTLITDPQQIKSLCSRWLGPSFWAPAVGKQGGAAILVKSNFSARISSWRRDSSGQVVLSEHKAFLSICTNFLSLLGTLF